MKVVERLVVRLIKDGAIEEEDREIYEYGFNQGIIMLVNIICTILIGIGMGMLWEVFVFMAAYIPLRTYGGGFHAKTQVRCFIYSNLLVVGILALSHLLTSLWIIYLILGVTGGVIVMLLAPVEDKNKPLDEKECEVYGAKARHILLLDFVVAAVLQFLGCYHLVSTIMVSIFFLGLFLIMGYLKNIRLKSMNNEF